MTKLKTDSFFLVEVEVTKAKEFVSFETKLPGFAKSLKGYQISANKSHESKALAIVGISFNGARENTINQELINRNPSTIRRRQRVLSQNMQILPNAYAKGFIEDLGVVQPPYLLKLYFNLSNQLK